MAHETNDQDKVWDLIDDIGICMYVTHDGQRLRARRLRRQLRLPILLRPRHFRAALSSRPSIVLCSMWREQAKEGRL